MLEPCSCTCTCRVKNWLRPPWIIGQSHATLVYRWAPRLMLSCRCTCCQSVTWSWPPPSKQCGYRKPIKTLSEKIKDRTNSSIIGQRFSPPSCKHCWGQEGVINIHPPFCYLHTERNRCRLHGCEIKNHGGCDLQYITYKNIHKELFVGGTQKNRYW